MARIVVTLVTVRRHSCKTDRFEEKVLSMCPLGFAKKISKAQGGHSVPLGVPCYDDWLTYRCTSSLHV